MLAPFSLPRKRRNIAFARACRCHFPPQNDPASQKRHGPPQTGRQGNRSGSAHKKPFSGRMPANGPARPEKSRPAGQGAERLHAMRRDHAPGSDKYRSARPACAGPDLNEVRTSMRQEGKGQTGRSAPGLTATGAANTKAIPPEAKLCSPPASGRQDQSGPRPYYSASRASQASFARLTKSSRTALFSPRPCM